MNRPLKFRFWDSKNKIMYSNTPEYAIGSEGEVSALIYDDSDIKDYVEWEGTYFSEHIVPLQYTGLKERFNLINPPQEKEIYEGDIVKEDGWDDIYYVVEFEEGKFVAKKTKGHGKGYNEKILNEILWPVVVGNIYENPELLGGNYNV